MIRKGRGEGGRIVHVQQCVESWLTETSVIFGDNRVTNTQYCLFIFLHYFDLGFPHAVHARMTKQS